MRYEPRVAALLVEIEEEMRGVGLWQLRPPAAQALASTMPFAIDRLSFPAWLQWICLPRMRKVLESGQPLLAPCQIVPAAEIYFSEFGIPCGRLMDLLAELDGLLGGPRDP